jgi:hypothetical protein
MSFSKSRNRCTIIGRAAVLMVVMSLLLPGLCQAVEELGYWEYRGAVRAAERLDHLTMIDSMEDDNGIYLAMGDRFGLVRIINLTGDGARDIWTSKHLGGVVRQVLSADLNQDGRDEIIAWTSAAIAYVWSADDQRELHQTLTNDFETIHSMTIGNVDSDPALEIIINADNHIYYLDGESFSREWTSIQEYQAERMLCADVDGDSSMELILNTGQVVDARGGDVEWEDKIFGARVEILDIDGDGIPEVLSESDGLPLRIFDVDHRKEKHLQ